MKKSKKKKSSKALVDLLKKLNSSMSDLSDLLLSMIVNNDPDLKDEDCFIDNNKTKLSMSRGDIAILKTEKVIENIEKQINLNTPFENIEHASASIEAIIEYAKPAEFDSNTLAPFKKGIRHLKDLINEYNSTFDQKLTTLEEAEEKFNQLMSSKEDFVDIEKEN